jgi:hypothetical protein
MPTTQTGVEDLAERIARRWCGRCDDVGLVWRRADGVTTTRDDPEAITAARCSHPTRFQLAPSVLADAGEGRDELADA